MKKNKKEKKQGSEYEVGYGKPPKHSRFKKKQSGNPGGRPVKRHIPSLWKQLDPLNSAILEQAARRLDIRTTEGKKTISQLEAALEKLFKMGMQGNRLSLVTFIELIQNAQDKEKKQIQEVFRAAVLHHQAYAEQFETAEREGRPVPKVLPNPKDVIIDLWNTDHQVQIVGPITWTEQEELEKNLEKRDLTDKMLKSYRVSADSGETHLHEIISKIEEGRARLNASLPPRLHKPPP